MRAGLLGVAQIKGGQQAAGSRAAAGRQQGGGSLTQPAWRRKLFTPLRSHLLAIQCCAACLPIAIPACALPIFASGVFPPDTVASKDSDAAGVLLRPTVRDPLLPPPLPPPLVRMFPSWAPAEPLSHPAGCSQ